MDSDDLIVERESEDAQIERWRIERFRQMGFSEPQIIMLQDEHVDLHDADYLISRGCEPVKAVQILV